MPAALARASQALDDRRLLRPAVTDSAVFTPWLLTSGGPDNGRLPTRSDRTQIAYGVDSRVQSLVAVADAAGSAGFREVAGITAAWYFGANAAGIPAYDPSTGRTVDCIAGDGTVNHNAGAESTIHGLLSMLALDANPAVAVIARQGHIVERIGTATVEAEQAALSGGATVVTPASAWTGEALVSGGSYVRMPPGSGTATVETCDADGARRSVTAERGSTVLALVPPGGFTVARRYVTACSPVSAADVADTGGRLPIRAGARLRSAVRRTDQLCKGR
jgi:hypothetical protein